MTIMPIKLAEAAPADGAGATGSPIAFTPAYRRWVLFLIFLMMTSNYIDRNIVRILAQPIKTEFRLSDLQVGLLGGFAFALFYIVMGVPIASFSERRNRVKIIATAVAVWSLMTALCGAAGTYLQLLAARVGVGIGEAGAAPPAQSLISDYFPPHQRASALSIFSFGIAFGTVVGAVIGGFVADAWGWRSAFLVVGAPGLLLAVAFLLTVKEPPRGHSDAARPTGETKPSFWTTARLLFTNATFLNLAFGCGIANFAIGGLHTFEALYFVRRFDVGLGQIGLMVGMVSGLSGAVGMLAGGFITDWIARRDRRWYAWLPALGVLLAAPLYAAAFVQPTLLLSAVFLALPGTLLFLHAAPAQAVIHNMSHPRMRATAISLYMVVTSTLGVALGPVVAGYLADRMAAARFTGPGAFPVVCPGGTPLAGAAPELAAACRAASASGLQFALVGVCLFLVWSAGHFLLASRTVRRDMDRGLHL